MARNESLGGRRVCRDVESTDTAGRKPRLRHGRRVLKEFSRGLCRGSQCGEYSSCFLPLRNRPLHQPAEMDTMQQSLAVLMLLTVAGAQSPMISHWKFDETAGLTASDSSPSANNGSLVAFTSGPAHWGAGIHGNALTFDGVDDYIDVAMNSGLPFFSGHGEAFSICVWVKGAANNDRRIMGLTSSSSASPFWGFGTGEGARAAHLRIYQRSDDNNSVQRYSDAVVFDNTWHHLALVAHASEVRLFVDGVLDTADFTLDFGHQLFSFDLMTLGAVQFAGVISQFAFSIDDLQLYAIPLTPADITTVMAGNTVSGCHSSIAEWGRGCGSARYRMNAFGSAALGGPGLQFAQRGGPPNAATFLAFGLGNPGTIDLGLFGLPGCTLYPSSPTSIGAVPLNAWGNSLIPTPFPVPNIPLLACQTVVFQSIAVGTETVTSNAVLALLGN